MFKFNAASDFAIGDVVSLHSEEGEAWVADHELEVVSKREGGTQISGCIIWSPLTRLMMSWIMAAPGESARVRMRITSRSPRKLSFQKSCGLMGKWGIVSMMKSIKTLTELLMRICETSIAR